MEPHTPSAFTPFLRRFTDERSKDLRELTALYEELRGMHKRSPYAADNALYSFGGDIYQTISERLPEDAIASFAGALSGISGLEQAVFDFPEIDFSRTQLSLKEQVDLQRFLTSKRHFLTNATRVAPLLREGLQEIFDLLTEDLPTLSGPSPFTIPLVHTLSDPKRRLDRLIGILWQQKFIDNGLFVDLSNTLHRNLCRVSNITDIENPKGKSFKLPSSFEGPLEQLVETYLQGTPLEPFLLAPVPLRLTHEDRFSHMHVLGGSGAGKTQLLQHLILHDLKSERPPSLVIVDSQGDLINKLSHLALFDPAYGDLADRLILITPKDTKFPPAINIFDLNRDRLGDYDEAAREQVTAGVIQTFDYLFTGLLGADLTAKQSVFFRFVARLMLALPGAMGRNATILDMIQLMEDPSPYRAAIESLPSIQRNFFERDFASKTFAQTKEQIRYRLNAILENPTLARLFTSTHTKIDMFEALNGGSIILVDTAKDFLKNASGHFGRIFISLVLQAVLERSVIAEEDRTPTFLIV